MLTPFDKQQEKILLEIIKQCDNYGYVVFDNDRIVIMNRFDVTSGSNALTLELDINPFPEWTGCAKFLIFSSASLIELKKQKTTIHFNSNEYGDLELYASEYCITNLNYYGYKQIFDIYHFSRGNILNLRNSTPLYTIEDLKANDEFARIMAGKAKDGGSLFILDDKYVLSLYSSILPINKPDKVSLNLYNFDQTSFLSEFIIQKKLFTIRVYIRYAHLLLSR